MTNVKLPSDAQKRILSNAADRSDRVILPLPDDFRARGAVRQKVLEALLKQGLVVERTTTDDAAVWRRDARRRRLTLAMTPAGYAALGRLPAAAAAPADRPAADARSDDGSHSDGSPTHPTTTSQSVSPATATAPIGKLGAILAAMAGEQGATLAALVDLTGWLPHTTRAALSRLRQRGYPIHLVGEPGSKAYRLDAKAEG